ncbi:MAG: class I SAM-dependent methyltransferase [Deltaproteobacteria bacterium]|nr:class I SAM-dependent methyltransferase [Deltaproteobacteria bacterium]
MDDIAVALDPNTVSYPRWRLALHWIRELLPPNAKILDVGCFTGEFVRCLAQEGYFAFGIDLNQAAIGRAYGIPVDRAFFFWYKGERFPFENQTFDGVALMDVLEHVAREDAIVNEVRRVLKKGGIVICSVPNQGRYAWMDPDNLKFSFPQTHKLFYTVLGQRQIYSRKYQKDSLLFGNFARAGSQRHRHYSLAQLESLWGANFSTLRVHRGGGLGFLIGYLGNKICFRICRRRLRAFSKMLAKSFLRDDGDDAYNLQVLMRKIS